LFIFGDGMPILEDELIAGGVKYWNAYRNCKMNNRCRPGKEGWKCEYYEAGLFYGK
jgi:hypothetical protein